MNSIYDDTVNIFMAFHTFDSWEIQQALQTDAVWIFTAIITIFCGGLILGIYRIMPWMRNYFEKTVMVSTYLLMGGIISIEVVRRFFFGVQSAWSTTLPPMLFLIVTWFSCAYNVKLRSHLSFQEFRSKMPRAGQLLCLLLDSVLWIVFSWVVTTASLKIIINSATNFQTLLGTNNVMQWWFLMAIPISFTLIVARSFENIIKDYNAFKVGNELIVQAVIGEGN